MSDDNQNKPLRILIVDNNPQQRADLVEHLKGWSYEYYVAEAPLDAEDSYSALLEDAQRKARNHRCHLALVDMRLRDDSNERDYSGWMLIPKLAPTISIILSAHLDNHLISEIMAPGLVPPKRVCDCVNKADSPETLQKAIQKAERDIWGRRPLTFKRPRELESEALVRRLTVHDNDAPSDEVDDVLRRLFPKAERLKVELAAQKRRFSSLPLRQRFCVVKVSADDALRPVIVKLGRSGRISEELDRFTKAKERFPSARYAQPQSTSLELWDLGGTTYEFLGDQHDFPVVSFRDYYKSRKGEEIGRALANFYGFWQHLYRMQPGAKGQNRVEVFSACNQVWGDEWCLRLLEFRSSPLAKEYPRQFRRLGLPSPISWLIDRVQLVAPGHYNDGDIPSTEIALIHGDLHGDNLFVDTRSDIWVIDFERTGFGPILQDWTELENDILTQLAEMDSGDEDWQHFFSLLIALLAPTTIRLDITAPSTDGQFEKEWVAIGKLRELAARSAPASDGRQYMWGLLLNAIFRLTLLMKEISDEARQPERQPKLSRRSQTKRRQFLQRCLLLAGLICHRLDHWHEEWPPQEWRNVHIRKKEPITPDNKPAIVLSQQDQTMSSPTNQTKILFLAANPLDTTPILIDEEIRAIDAAWQRGKFRDSFLIEQHHAVRYNELQELLVRHQPRIVHFSGHGTDAGIVLSRDDGNSQLVSAEDLGNLFRVLKQDITCVVLNACYADAQAQAIAQHIDVVIGMPGAVQDKSSIEFAAEFYFAIVSGLDVQTAFELGCLLITNPSSKRTPKMIALRSDPGRIAFMTATNTNNKEHCEHLRKLLKQHMRNLQHLEEQRAVFGVGAVPLDKLNGIDYEKDEIARIQSELQVYQC